MKRSCWVCKEPLFGRVDQKFCSDSCRSHFHNLKNQSKNRDFYKIHKTLQSNYRILRSYLYDHRLTTDVGELRRRGFMRNCITEVDGDFKTENPKYYLYDIGYEFIDRYHIRIFKRTSND